MKHIIITLVILLVAVSSHADLNLIGQGTSVHGTYNLIYDTDLDVTWYDYTYDSTSDYWPDYVSWASELVVNFGDNVYEDWRLPIVFDNNCGEPYCTTSEMSHLYYTELGNTANDSLSNMGDFQNLNPDWYWSETMATQAHAWYFDFSTGSHDATDAYGGCYYCSHPNMTIAVRNGLAVVPEPISSILFLTGSATLGLRRYLRQRKHS